MHYCTMTRISALLFAIEFGMAGASAQGLGGSPYSAYAFGDLYATGQATQAMMSGTGLALVEPYSTVLGNPASYQALARPVFEIGTAFRSTRSTTALESSTRRDAEFTGFTLGVPFARGKWGLALGLTPFSEVGYNARTAGQVGSDAVTYTYSGSGGLDRVFAGLARTLYSQRADSLGNTGMRVALGADFNFIFGSIEQTRDAVFAADAGFSNIRAFSSLVLRAPSVDASLIWQGDLTRKTHRDDGNWRWTAGVSVSSPTNFQARFNELVTTYVTSSGIEAVRDTIPGGADSKGNVTVPVKLGLGLGVQNRHWAFTVEAIQRPWSTTAVDVPGFSLAAPLRDAVSLAAAARYRPGTEEGMFGRAVYRMGLRWSRAPQEVRGEGLVGASASAGISFPLNLAQTNSWLHLGGEFGQRGTMDLGLVKESQATLWIGVAFTPWRGERWLTPYKIQ